MSRRNNTISPRNSGSQTTQPYVLVTQEKTRPLSPGGVLLANESCGSKLTPVGRGPLSQESVGSSVDSQDRTFDENLVGSTRSEPLLPVLMPEMDSPTVVTKYVDRVVRHATSEMVRLFSRSLSLQAQALESKLRGDARIRLARTETSRELERGKQAQRIERLVTEASEIDEEGRHLDMLVQDIRDRRLQLSALVQTKSQVLWPESMTVDDMMGSSEKAEMAKKGKRSRSDRDEVLEKQLDKRLRHV
ncbi:hypothetical protein BGX27_004876 [Mortierella sp. AM989]|nr:hypothetical protein BGX27_004876 [Mortierella sp. AM989]